MNKTRPNILFILMDDQRADAMGCAGNKILKTPALDQLARRGTRFTRAYNMGSTVPAVCVASRAMLHTGHNLWHLEDCGRTIPDHQPLLGETLAQAGYHCHAIGKWHNETASLSRSFHSGAELYLSGMCDPWNAPLCDYDPSGHYNCWKPICANPEYSNRTYPMRYTHIQPGKHCTEIFTDAAITYLRQRRPQSQPFFLHLAYTAPHDPRLAPEDWHRRYPAENIPLPDNFLPEHPFDNGELRVRDELLAPFPRTPECVRKHIADYYAMMSHADDHIGRLLAELDSLGLGDNTIIIHTADHGLALGSHGLMGKQNLYEHSTQIPLIMSGPGIPQNTQRNQLCYHFDLFPTLCDLAQVHTPPPGDGISLLPAIQSPTASTRKHLTFGYRDLQRAVLSEDGQKIIRYQTDGDTIDHYFDLARDPHEQASQPVPPRAYDLLQHLHDSSQAPIAQKH